MNLQSDTSTLSNFCSSKDIFLVYPSVNTYFKPLTNLDEVNRDRYAQFTINAPSSIDFNTF
jgi:hypothetical protein